MVTQLTIGELMRIHNKVWTGQMRVFKDGGICGKILVVDAGDRYNGVMK